MNYVIGLTGGIASGKSTASDYIRSKGYPVLDADTYAKKATAKGGPAYQGIIDHFGADLLQDDGEIDRRKLGAIVFNDTSEREVLNQLVHPEVRRMMDEDKERLAESGHVFLDIPLLFENGLDRQCDLTLTVYVDQETQIERLMERNGFSHSEALSRINSQMPLSEKRDRSTEVLDNRGSKDALYDQIEDFLVRIEK
ncbi:dephospho-CoA kinase [Salinicoccus roseus]|jgi:dephospho-CoA kinase|uniref:Dephospho-CoA kinase n=1 Tax=Salinicoccus roseus TaxID=45670 RepID=A0A0C2HER1_9STAP|nr:dephospho-CoA kinase [Salinicoccus roseus]KIH70114.1 dephospho-CoA kinase [Salinicoccus roseus]MDB0581437.1 dephospho-CoA kinase [Salinicoccus roseus]